MSTSNRSTTRRTLSSSSADGAPAQEKQAPETTATSQQTAVSPLEGWGSVSANGDQDEQVDLMVMHREHLTNMDQNFPDMVKILNFKKRMPIQP